MNFRNDRNEVVCTGRSLGKGGEAEVFAVDGHPSLVAKIYHEPTGERTAKLQAMIHRPPVDEARKQGHISICWPESMLFDENRQCRGFLMPCMDPSRNYELFKVYHPRSRAQARLNPTWGDLMRAAENMAIAVESIHARGYVIGDVNESNFFVSEQALITVVDCDSMQVPVPGGLLRCTVFKPEYMAPELHGCDLHQVVRTKEQDEFALAILIFMLLMEGFHPYAGVWKEAGDPPSREECIRNGDSPYAGSTRMDCPPGAPSLTNLPESLRALVKRTFGPGHDTLGLRPSAGEWRAALAGAEKVLRSCKRNPVHRYGKHLRLCPWCGREALLAPPLPAVPAQRPLKTKPFTQLGAAPGRAAGLASTKQRTAGTVFRRLSGWRNWLYPVLSGFLCVLLLPLAGQTMGWRYLGFVVVFAAALGLLRSMLRRNTRMGAGHAALLAGGGIIAYVHLPGVPSAWWLPAIGAWGTRSALLQVQPVLEWLEWRGQKAVARGLLAGTLLLVPCGGLGGALGLQGTLTAGNERMPVPAATPGPNVTTCARVRNGCECQVKSVFASGEDVLVSVISPLRTATRLEAVLPGGAEVPAQLGPWRGIAAGSCATARIHLPPGTQAGQAMVRLVPVNGGWQDVTTGFSVVAMHRSKLPPAANARASDMAGQPGSPAKKAELPEQSVTDSTSEPASESETRQNATAPQIVWVSPDRIRLSAAEAARNLILHTPPVSSPMFLGVNDEVVFSAVISKEGAVTRLVPLRGPQALYAAAGNAVGEWLYEPYRVGSKAVEVQTEIAVRFGREGQ